MGLVRQQAGNERHPQSLADRWFRALDQRRIRAGAQSWVAQVLGIHSDGGEIWVQLGRGESPEKSIVLHLSGWTTMSQATAAIRTQSRDFGAFPRVVTAIPTV